MQKLNVAFDIDDTLYKIVEDTSADRGDIQLTDTNNRRLKQVPDYELLHVLRWFAGQGHNIYVWSAGGTDYAKMIIEKLGLEIYVTDYLIKGHLPDGQKMDLTFDDQEVKTGLVNIQIKREEI